MKDLLLACEESQLAKADLREQNEKIVADHRQIRVENVKLKAEVTDLKAAIKRYLAVKDSDTTATNDPYEKETTSYEKGGGSDRESDTKENENESDNNIAVDTNENTNTNTNTSNTGNAGNTNDTDENFFGEVKMMGFNYRMSIVNIIRSHNFDKTAALTGFSVDLVVCDNIFIFFENLHKSEKSVQITQIHTNQTNQTKHITARWIGDHLEGIAGDCAAGEYPPGGGCYRGAG